MKIRFYTFKNFLIKLGIIIIDLAVYMVLGLLLMSYDDAYDESRGEYWSWASMTAFDKAVVTGLYTWHAVNIIGIIYILYRFINSIRQKTETFSAETRKHL